VLPNWKCSVCHERLYMKRIISKTLGLALILGLSGTLSSPALARSSGTNEKRLIAAGATFACAIAETGLVRCWGSGSAINVPANLGNVSEIFAGFQNACAIKIGGAVVCWGPNTSGIPEVPNSLGTVKQVSIAANFACAIKSSDSSLQCWGRTPTVPDEFIYTKTSFTQVSLGQSHACAIYNNGRLNCWGNNDFGQVEVPSFKGKVLKVSSGRYRTCAIGESYLVKCWGNDYSSWTEDPPKQLQTAIDVSIGVDDHACGIQMDSSVICWGGDPQFKGLAPNSRLGKIYQVSSGGNFTCTLNGQGIFTCDVFTVTWGNGPFGLKPEWALDRCAELETGTLRCFNQVEKVNQIPLLGKVLSKSKGISSVAVTGSHKVGQRLTATVKSLDTGTKISFIWKRGSQPIAGAVTNNYKLVNADKGKSISVEVTTFKPGFTLSTKVSKTTVVK
jgi:hypothetical protein